jgi:NAD(P)-dependent dehydrogenase (short-subunit alcohol dehydrogenase family)
MRATVPSMLRAGGGSIINIASVATPIGLRGSIPYQASKAAVLGLTRGAAISYGPDNIRVNAICPGLVITSMTESAALVAGRTLMQIRTTSAHNRPDRSARLMSDEGPSAARNKADWGYPSDRTCPAQRLALGRSDPGELNLRPAPMTFRYRSWSAYVDTPRRISRDGAPRDHHVV